MTRAGLRPLHGEPSWRGRHLSRDRPSNTLVPSHDRWQTRKGHREPPSIKLSLTCLWNRRCTLYSWLELLLSMRFAWTDHNVCRLLLPPAELARTTACETDW